MTLVNGIYSEHFGALAELPPIIILPKPSSLLTTNPLAEANGNEEKKAPGGILIDG